MSKTDPFISDTDGDGMIDGWEVINGLSARMDDSTNSLSRVNYRYDPVGWLTNTMGLRIETVVLDPEGNTKQVSQ